MKKALKILAICLIFFVFGLYALFLNFPKFINVDSYIEKAQKEIGLIFEFDELKIQPKYNFLVSVSLVKYSFSFLKISEHIKLPF